jgi:hypothetical protein
MKFKPMLILLMVLVACGMVASYLTRLIIAERSARIASSDKDLLHIWTDVLRYYPEMRSLLSRAAAVRNWAQTCGDHYGHQQFRFRVTLYISEVNCPAWLTPTQAEVVRAFTRTGVQSAQLELEHKSAFTWTNAFVGRFPPRYKKPSECLNQRCLRQCVSEPFQHPVIYPLGREEVAANRAVLEQMANNPELLKQIADNRRLVELMDECWQIGYEAGCKDYQESP